MKRRKKELQEIVDSHLGLFSEPSSDQVERAEERALLHLSATPADVSQKSTAVNTVRHFDWRWRFALACAVAAVVIVVATQVSRWGAASESYRSNGDSGNVVKLSDGSRVEMRSQTEFSVEKAQDGLRIHLIRGSVIVNAAKQGAGHLYVQTKDVAVSVVGTVFLVNAEEEGSRVAVIEGEVRVKQGQNEKSLRPGEQIVTSPTMSTLPVQQEIAWSREAVAHTALLQQVREVREVFDVASIRPAAVTSSAGAGGRGAGGGGGQESLRPYGEPCGDPSGDGKWSRFFLTIDPRRFDANDVTVHALISWAYHMQCSVFRGVDVVGGPDWIKTDGYDIKANIPEGSPTYTKTQFLDGEAPKLQKMLQSLLEDRFKLVLRRQTKEMRALVLTAPNGPAKLTAWKEGDPTSQVQLFDYLARNGKLATNDMLSYYGVSASEFAERWLNRKVELPTSPLGLDFITAAKASMSDLTKAIQAKVSGRGAASANNTIRPVVDRTGISGTFNYHLVFRSPNPVSWPEQWVDTDAKREAIRNSSVSSLSLAAAVERELGLKLEEMTVPVEVWVIDRVERPSEN